jgi:hypothetical protein
MGAAVMHRGTAEIRALCRLYEERLRIASFTESVRHASYIPAGATKIKMVMKRRKCEMLYRLGDFCTDKSVAEEVMAS